MARNGRFSFLDLVCSVNNSVNKVHNAGSRLQENRSISASAGALGSDVRFIECSLSHLLGRLQVGPLISNRAAEAFHGMHLPSGLLLVILQIKTGTDYGRRRKQIS